MPPRAPSTCLVELAECKRLRRAFGISSLTNVADFRPDLECLPPGRFVLGGSDVIAAEMKEVVDLIVGREEALRLASRFELLHLPLSSARRLVRILGSVVQSLCWRYSMLGMTSLFCKLFGDHDAGRPHLLLPQLPVQPLGSLLVASALDQNVEHDAGLVHGSPQPMLHPGNFEYDLIAGRICASTAARFRG